MTMKIVIIGATGTLGSKLIKYCHKKSINIDSITYFKNKKKANFFINNYGIKNCFCLNDKKEKSLFIKYISSTSIDLIYFLDFGSGSLDYAYHFLKNNSKSFIAIANKEMLLAGGKILIKFINKTFNTLIPLDSEHFSLINSNYNSNDISKVFITASGGPFYFKKNINLNKVNFQNVISHPKWKMGVNNSIDSSNFINKILEMHELSIIYNLDINKISFLVTKNAFVHSIIKYKDGTISLNCFKNDMLISLLKPLRYFYHLEDIKVEDKYILDHPNFKFSEFKDKRFKITKYLKLLKDLSHDKLIRFMILNNIAQKKYIDNEHKYNDIVPFIINRLGNKKKTFRNFNSILKYITQLKKYYENIP